MSVWSLPALEPVPRNCLKKKKKKKLSQGLTGMLAIKRHILKGEVGFSDQCTFKISPGVKLCSKIETRVN